MVCPLSYFNPSFSGEISCLRTIETVVEALMICKGKCHHHLTRTLSSLKHSRPIFFYLRALTATLMVHMLPRVPPRALLRFEKKSHFQMLHEISHFGRGRKTTNRRTLSTVVF